METTSGSRSPSTATLSGGGNSDQSKSFSTERISKYLIQYVPETPVRKKAV